MSSQNKNRATLLWERGFSLYPVLKNKMEKKKKKEKKSRINENVLFFLGMIFQEHPRKPSSG